MDCRDSVEDGADALGIWIAYFGYQTRVLFAALTVREWGVWFTPQAHEEEKKMDTPLT